MVDSSKRSTFLSKTRDRISFEERVQTKAVNTQKTSQSAIRNFERFCKENYDKSMEEIISEYQKVEMNIVYESLQEWINWNNAKIHSNSIPTLFSYLKTYLRYHKIRITKEDGAEQLSFSHKVKEEKHPLTKEEIKRILQVSNKNNTIKILVQLSSGHEKGEIAPAEKKRPGYHSKENHGKYSCKHHKDKKIKGDFF